jgi:hypothetical protein
LGSVDTQAGRIGSVRSARWWAAAAGGTGQRIAAQRGDGPSAIPTRIEHVCPDPMKRLRVRSRQILHDFLPRTEPISVADG